MRTGLDQMGEAEVERRGFGRVAPVVVALAVAGFYAPLWLGQQLYRRDTWRMLVPCRAYIGERLRAGEFPAWYPYDALGTPFHAQAVCGVLHPLTWLSAFLRPELVITLQSLTAVALAAWGTWRLSRLLGATPAGSAVAAVAYALGGYLTSETANLVYLWGAALLPVQLYAFGRAALLGWDRSHFALALAACASTLLIGDIQGAYLFTLVAGCFGLALSQGRWKHYLAGSALCAVLLAGLCAGQLLPSWSLLQGSGRSRGIPWNDATYWSLHPLRLPELFLPAFSPLGAPGRAQGLFGSLPGYLLWAEALGGSAVASFLAVLGLVHPGLPRRIRAVLGAFVLVGLLLALGRYGGLYRLAYEALPLMSSFRWPEKLTPLFLAPWAVLAALGLERSLSGPWRPAAIAAGALAVLALGSLALAPRFEPLMASYLGDLGYSLGFGAGALLLCALLARARPALRAPALFMLVLLETVSGSLAIFDARPLSDSARPPTTVETLQSLGARVGALRTMSLGFDVNPLTEADFATVAEQRQADIERDALMALLGGQYGIEMAGLYFQGYPSILLRMLSSPEHGLRSIAPRLNIGLALTSEQYTGYLVDQGFRQHGTSATGVAILDNPQVWPRAYLAAPRGLERGKDPIGLFAGMPRGQVLMREWDGPPAPPIEGSARITSYAPEEVHIQLESPAPAVLVLNDLHSPGWSATVDGAEAEVLNVNLVVRGVPVPAGTHEVVFQYEAPGLSAGLSISLLALALTLLLLWRWPLRSPAPEPT